jgi:hypothetical protein
VSTPSAINESIFCYQIPTRSDFHDRLHEDLRSGVDEALEAVRLVLTEIGTLQGNASFFIQRLKWSVGQT